MPVCPEGLNHEAERRAGVLAGKQRAACLLLTLRKPGWVCEMGPLASLQLCLAWTTCPDLSLRWQGMGSKGIPTFAVRLMRKHTFTKANTVACTASTFAT